MLDDGNSVALGWIYALHEAMVEQSHRRIVALRTGLSVICLGLAVDRLGRSGRILRRLKA
jgi:hypothetical protein